MGEVPNHPIQILLTEGFETVGVGIGLGQTGEHLALLGGFHVFVRRLALGLQEFVAMIVEPANEPSPFLWRQGLNGGFNLLNAHAEKLTSFLANLRSKRGG